MTNLFKVENGDLIKIEKQKLSDERQLESWISKDPSIIGLDLLVIGCQVSTDFKGCIDILAMDNEGALVILELKRDKTPRDIVAQILDYASWVATLTTKRIHEIAKIKLNKSLDEAFQERFDIDLPENLNNTHSMVIVASEIDISSKRIVEYLAEKHDVNINTAFFNVFEIDSQLLLATDWLMDQEEVVVRATSRKKHTWTGFYYVNAGTEEGTRNWEDMKKYGFISAGGGRVYSKPLDKLKIGDKIFVYQKDTGYIGYGIVRATSVRSIDFQTVDGKTLNQLELQENGILHDSDSEESSEYIVGVDWLKTFPMDEAKQYKGIFANQNIVCKLSNPQTLKFLIKEFGVSEMGEIVL